MKKLLLISIMLIVLCSLSAVSASEINGTDDIVSVDSDVSASCDIVSASEINGTAGVDDGDLLSAPSTSTVTVSTWSNLRKACTNATQYDTIYVNGGFAPTNQIAISKSVTIEGLTGSYIGGSSSNNVVNINFIPFYTTKPGLNITFKNLNFQNLNIQNSNPFSGNVLMYFAGNGNYACENCNFNNINGTGTKQSIIWLKQGTSNILNCNFTNNVLSFGTITNFYSSSSSTVNNARMSISDCRFTNNYGSYAPGAINNCGYMDIHNSVFEDNGADKWAGAVLSYTYATTNIVNSSFKNNVAGWNGGAIYTYSVLNVFNSTFEGNNCTTNNGGGAIGALSYGSTYNVTVDNCIFKNNHNLDSAGYGGAISAMDAGYFHLYYSTFINNTATTGKAIAVREGEYIDDNHTWDENVTLGNPVFGIAYNTFVDVEAHINDANIAYVSNNASYIAAHNNTFYTPSEYANLANYQQSNVNNGELLGLSLDDVEVVGDSQDTPQWAMDGFDSSNSMESPYSGVSDGAIVWNKTYDNIFSLVIDKEGYVLIGQRDIIDFLNNEGNLEKNISTKNYIQMGYHAIIDFWNISISPENVITIVSLVTWQGTVMSGPCYILPEFYDGPGEHNYNPDGKAIPGKNHIVFVIDKNNKVEYVCIDDSQDYLKFMLNNDGLFDETDFSYDYSWETPAPLNVIVADTIVWGTTSEGFNIYDVSKDDASVLSSISAPGIVGTPVADANGNVYFFTSDSIKKADTTGVLKTQAVTDGIGSRMAVSTKNNALYSVNALGALYKYSLSDLTETKLADIESTASTIMTDANGIIYVGSDDGKFYAFDDEGNQKWMVDTESTSAVKNCAMDNEGNIYFYTAENKVYAINEAPLADANLTFKVDEKFNTTDDITFTANINSTLDGQNITFTVTGTDNDYKNSTNATIGDGVATWDIGKLPAGNYKVEAKYVSDGTFADANVENTFEVTKVTPELSVNINNATVFENATITVTSSNCEGNVTVKVGDKYTYENVTIGEEFTLPLLPAEVYDVTVTYNKDSIYNEAVNDTEKLEISKVSPELSVNINNATVFENATITVTSSNCEGNVTVKVGDDYTYENVVIGEEFTLPLLPIGVYDVVVTYAEDANYTDAVNDTEKLEIAKEEPMVEPYVSDDGSEVILSFGGKESGNVFLDVAGVGYYAIIEDGEATFNIDALEPGNHTATVYYPGDENYKNTTFDITIKVPELLNPELGVNVKDTTITVSLNENATGTVIVTVGDISFVMDADKLEPIDVADYLAPGKYDVYVEYLGDENFTDATAENSVTVPEVEPLDPKLDVSVDGTVVTVSLNENATGYVVVSADGKDLFFEYDGEPVVVDFSDLEPGNYTVEVTYSGDDVFASDNASAKLSVPEVELLDSELKVDIQNTTVTVSINENATGDVIITVGDISFIQDADELAPIDVSEYLTNGTYPVTVKYVGDDVFAEKVLIGGKVTVPEDPVVEPKDPNLKASAVNSTVTVTVDKDATGSVLVDVDGQGYYAEIKDGKAVIEVIGLDAGTYSAVVYYAGDDVFASANTTVSVTVPEDPVVEPKDPNLKATAVNSTVTVTVDKDATGDILVDVDGQGYYAEIKNGKAVIDVIGLDAGTYKASVIYLGDDVFASANATVSVTVPKKEDPTPEPVDPKADIKITNETVSVNLPKDATGYVLVDVDGTGYYVPVKDGKASFDLPELAPGNHTVAVTYTGDKKYDSANATQTIEVVSPVETIVAENLTKIEKAPDKFVAKFSDKDGKALANTKVTFAINGGTYTRTTDANGEASFAINLAAGTYTMVTTNPVTGETKENSITVLSRFAENNDLVKYFRNASQYVVKVLGDDGKPAVGEVVTFNINGVFYNRTVNASGYVKMNINLNPGDYVITAEYKGCKVSNNIKVLPVLTGKDLTKKFGEPGQFEATLVDGQGKAYANQQIEFNINGVFYKRTTNANGVAKLNINLQPGVYIITSTYGQAAISNKVTVTA